MKTIKRISSSIALLALSSIASASPDFSTHSTQASKHSALASAHIAIASVKTVASVVAVPLIIAGEAGKLSTAAGTSLLESSEAYTPLEITETTVTYDPSPATAMQ